MTTGELLKQRKNSAATKEALHVAILAKVLDKDPLAAHIYSETEALDMLHLKI